MKLEYENIIPDDGSSFKLIQWKSENDRFFWHQHPEYELIYVRQGSGRLHVGDYVGSYKAGDLLFLGPNLPHTGLGYGVIGTHEELIVQLSERFMELGGMHQLPEMKRIIKLFNLSKRGLIFTGDVTKSVGKRLEKMLHQSGIERLISLLQILKDLSLHDESRTLNSKNARFEFRHKDEDRIGKIYSFVEQNYQQAIELATVADLANMTVQSFCRYFKKMTRMTFTDFVNEFRVKQACRLLMTNKVIADICFESGFNNVSHFNKTFKNVIGESPRNYRKKLIP
ncbi:MAG: AraC family transcriptional regulator [Spirosomaceae bacterium]|nr:AraC family transcriptional regulator [Spirosomataceae bacterium]